MIDLLAGPADAVVEPWKPKVGQRVRTIVSPDCLFPNPSDVLGVVSSPRKHPDYRLIKEAMISFPHHRFLVLFDDWVEHCGDWYIGSIYAACELEPE